MNDQRQAERHDGEIEIRVELAVTEKTKTLVNIINDCQRKRAELVEALEKFGNHNRRLRLSAALQLWLVGDCSQSRHQAQKRTLGRCDEIGAEAVVVNHATLCVAASSKVIAPANKAPACDDVAYREIPQDRTGCHTKCRPSPSL